MTTLLRAIWADEAGPAEACARVRWLMSRQLTRTDGPGVDERAVNAAIGEAAAYAVVQLRGQLQAP